jgi:hypothetical protein
VHCEVREAEDAHAGVLHLAGVAEAMGSASRIKAHKIISSIGLTTDLGVRFAR